MPPRMTAEPRSWSAKFVPFAAQLELAASCGPWGFAEPSHARRALSPERHSGGHPRPARQVERHGSTAHPAAVVLGRPRAGRAPRRRHAVLLALVRAARR